jgi:serine phosphatase RsbU (regulator of sigma subunit)
MHSLKTKLVVAISFFVLILFGLSTFLSLGEKQKELTQDIFDNARSYASLTAEDIVESYSLYIPQESFVYFNRDVQSVFSKFQDLASIQIVNFNGEIVYDSSTDVDKIYTGPVRMVDDNILNQVQAKNPSVYTLDTDRFLYLQEGEEYAEGYIYVNENEQPLKPLASDEKVEYIVQPATDEFSVVYYLSYENLQERIFQTMIRGVLMGVFGIGIGILIAYLLAVRITKPLKKLTIGAGIIAKGDFKHRVEVGTKDELNKLAGAFNSMAKELEISTKALVYKERVAKELELAAEIQKNLLPKEIPKVAGMDIAAGVLPAEEIGGDCYDFIKTDDDNLLMYMGDVTGHGVPSGIIVSITNALIFNYSNELDLKQLLTDVNRILKEKTSANMFITLVMLHYNAETGVLRYVSGGHEQMIHYHAKDNKVTLTPAGGLALGMIPDISNVLKEEIIHLEEGDALVAYSDGIPEAWKSEKDMYGMGRLKRSVNEYSDLPSALAIRNAILADVKEWTGGWKQMDDITALVLKKTKGGIEAAGKDSIQKTVEKAEASKKEEVPGKKEAKKPESKGDKDS